MEEKKGENIVLLDVSGVTSFTDYFVICNGTSSRSLSALSETIERAARKEFKLHTRVEGKAEDGWILMDMGDVIVHLFSPDQRKYYGLDELWNEGKVIVKFQ